MQSSNKASVFYEDTDCMGIVCHASYVRFLERGRTLLLDSLGLNAAQWMDAPNSAAFRAFPSLRKYSVALRAAIVPSATAVVICR